MNCKSHTGTFVFINMPLMFLLIFVSGGFPAMRIRPLNAVKIPDVSLFPMLGMVAISVMNTPPDSGITR